MSLEFSRNLKKSRGSDCLMSMACSRLSAMYRCDPSVDDIMIFSVRFLAPRWVLHSLSLNQYFSFVPRYDFFYFKQVIVFANFNRISCTGGKFFTGESLPSSDKMYVCIGLNLCGLFT